MGVFEKFRTFLLEKIKIQNFSNFKKCSVIFKKYVKKMPYGYTDKRRTAPRNRGTAKRTRKTYRSNSIPGFRKTLVGNTGRKAYGYNTGQMLHLDRPVTTNRGPFPNRLYAKLRYVDNTFVTADNLTGLTGTELAWRLNSLFDPYFPAGGHQPLGFDQLTPMYQRYKVFKVDMNIAVRGRSGSALPFVGINIRNGASTYNLGSLKALGEVLEQPGNTVMDGTILQSWNQTVWMHNIEGRTYQEYLAEDAYGAQVTTNPSLTPYLGIACGTVDTPSSSSNSVYITVALVFHAFFYEANPLAQS